MLKSTILALTAILTLGAIVSTPAGAAFVNLPVPPVIPPPPPPNNPGAGLPGPFGPVTEDPTHKVMDEGPSFATHPENQMLIACRVPAGASSDSTNLAFRNIGGKVIPLGTTVQWQVRSTGQFGQFALTADLAPGKELTGADLLDLGVPAKTACLSILL